MSTEKKKRDRILKYAGQSEKKKQKASGNDVLEQPIDLLSSVGVHIATFTSAAAIALAMQTTVEVVNTCAQCHEKGFQFSFASGGDAAVDHTPQPNRQIPTCNAVSSLEPSRDNVREDTMPISTASSISIDVHISVSIDTLTPPNPPPF